MFMFVVIVAPCTKFHAVGGVGGLYFHFSWAVTNGLDPALIDPGKPWQNGTNESFNGKFWDECLGMEWFRTRAEAKVRIETWR
jgi:hypothetical protein|tara:strand:+ start:2456 stop:2704 length:249 start_codon:yes stop_codon:yes gene_type:complete